MTDRNPDKAPTTPLEYRSVASDRPTPDRACFDQALFDLHYHLLAVQIQGLPPMPDPEEYGIRVDAQGNVTRIDSPA